MDDAGFSLKLPRTRPRKGDHERVRQTKVHEPRKEREPPTVEDGLDDWDRWQEDRDEAQ
jgi:hypothetical protein